MRWLKVLMLAPTHRSENQPTALSTRVSFTETSISENWILKVGPTHFITGIGNKDGFGFYCKTVAVKPDAYPMIGIRGVNFCCRKNKNRYEHEHSWKCSQNNSKACIFPEI